MAKKELCCFVVFALIAHSTAYIPALGAASFNAGLLGRRPVPSLAQTFVTRPNVVLRMTEAKESIVAPEIDFGKVGISDGSESGFSGMIFRPEVSEDPESRCRIDWDVKCEKAVNDHINVEFTASYAYHALFAYFDRDTVALNGFAEFFRKQAEEERTHAEEFMKYQNKRGGKVVLKAVAVPEMQFTRVDGASDALYAMELALQLEKFVYGKLKQLHVLGVEAGDAQLCDEVEKYLGDQVAAIKGMAGYVAQIRRVGTGHGVWDMDRVLAQAPPL